MLRLSKFLLYCFAVFVGVAGLLEGGVPLLKYAIERLKGNYFDAYTILSSYDRFSSEVILVLSLMLLIVVHIGHVLAGGLRFTKPGKAVSPETQTGVLPRTPLTESSSTSSASSPAPAASDVASANEKLAHLVTPPQDKPIR